MGGTVTVVASGVLSDGAQRLAGHGGGRDLCKVSAVGGPPAVSGRPDAVGVKRG